jgi:short-chain fatty acids transporter
MALSPPVQRALSWVARIPSSAAAASALVALVACGAALVHWGLGAIAGALLAREIGRHAKSRGLSVHYPLLGAAAYAGMAVWHGGLSGSAPLKVAEAAPAGIAGALPLSDTLLAHVNLVVTPALVVLIPILCALLTPRRPGELSPPGLDQLAPLPARTRRQGTGLVHWLQESAAVGAAVGVAGLAFVLAAVVTSRLRFDINSVNMLFLFAGLVLQGSLRHYVEAITDGARGAGAIILQFPLYFGILGMMKAADMIRWISDGLVALSSQTTFPVVAYLSAGLVNLFVPSGGGQWAVQGDVLLTAGHKLGVDPGATVMAFAYGDAWTNMLQPFWALPLLGIMGLRARDIIGYTATIFLLMLIVVPVLLLIVA